MIRSATTYVLLFLALPAQADPFRLSNSSVFGLGTSELEESGGPFIEELGLQDAFRAQSRAVELLGNEFSRAATQGLIDAQETPSQSNQTDISGNLGERANLSVINGIDRDIATSPNVPPTATGAICLSDRDVDVANWGDAKDHRQLGKLRTQAIAENGDVTSKGALKLARFYLAMGFGSEAKDLARLVESPRDSDIVMALADIIDTGTSDSPALKGQVFCEGAVALWAALAQPLSNDEVPKSTNAILSAFSNLPFHLRVHLGPHLPERFRKAGLNEQARKVLNATLRSGPKSVESKLAKAKLELSGPKPVQARNELVDISNGTDVSAAKALLELLEDAQRDQRPPDVAWVEDVPSLVRATEGTEIASALNLAGLMGLIRLSRFDDVRLALKEDAPGLTDLTRSSLAASALSEAAEVASDAEFIRSVIGFPKYIDDISLERNERFQIAERLASLGLFQRAASFLPRLPASVSERRTTSAVLSNLGQTASAIEVIEDEPQELLPELGELYAQRGYIQEALASFSDGGQNEVATRLAIQAGEWDWVAQNGDDNTSAATQALRSSIETDTGLPINGALIRQSEKRRDQAKKLLSALEAKE